MRWPTYLMTGALISAAAILSACENADPEPEIEDPQPASAPAGPDGIQVIYAENGERIRLTGKVVNLGADGLLLDYGTGTIPVVSSSETRGFSSLQAGEEVTIVGVFDERAGGDRVLASEIAVEEKP